MVKPCVAIQVQEFLFVFYLISEGKEGIKMATAAPKEKLKEITL